jgi:DNA invertase Pin-like site-specific DNA recombinase
MSGSNEFIKSIEAGTLDGQSVLAGYCSSLYKKHGTYEEVARITKLDRRTVKKHIQSS